MRKLKTNSRLFKLYIYFFTLLFVLTQTGCSHKQIYRIDSYTKEDIIYEGDCRLSELSAEKKNGSFTVSKRCQTVKYRGREKQAVAECSLSFPKYILSVSVLWPFLIFSTPIFLIGSVVGGDENNPDEKSKGFGESVFDYLLLPATLPYSDCVDSSGEPKSFLIFKEGVFSILSDSYEYIPMEKIFNNEAVPFNLDQAELWIGTDEHKYPLEQKGEGVFSFDEEVISSLCKTSRCKLTIYKRDPRLLFNSVSVFADIIIND